MAVSGIVIRLEETPARRTEVLAELGLDSRVALGKIDGAKIPAVVDTPTARQDRACFEWIGSLAGVVGVDLVCVHYDVEETASGDPNGSQR